MPVNAIKTWTVPGQRVHNLTVADLHTYYVVAGGQPVLVHNDNNWCDDDLKAMEEWDKGRSSSVEESARYHIGKHGKGRTFAEYTKEAKALWDKTPAKDRIRVEVGHGKKGWKIKGDLWSGEGIYTDDGKIVTWWD